MNGHLGWLTANLARQGCSGKGSGRGPAMRRGRSMTATGADSQALLRARFGIDLPGTEVPDEIASLIDRRVTRRYTEQDVPDSLLDALLAAAQSAPAKSDLQQFSV